MRLVGKIGCAGLTLSLLSACYVTKQAWHQGALLRSRRPVDDVVEDPQTPLQVRQQLTQVRSILAYAAGHGLHVDGAYETYIQTREPVVSYLVQAAMPTKLEFVTWWFPVVGRVPYLGFYSRDERNEEAQRLRSEGYDVAEGSASAFSSLGWFSDPIFSSMLSRKHADLAHLFFHELTHRTIWVPDSAPFNENLAEYVAESMTRQYLTEIGEDSALQAYLERRSDKELFSRWLQALRQDLEHLYQQNQVLSKSQILSRKVRIFSEYQKSPLKPRFKQVDYVAAELWNNASVLGASLYAPEFRRFDALRNCLGKPEIKDFLMELKALIEQKVNNLTLLEQYCETYQSEKRAAHVD